MISAIYVLWLRQVKRYLRRRERIIGSLGQPLLFLIALGFGMGPVYQAAGEGNYIQFLAPGIIAMSILFTAIFSGIEVIWDKQFGFLKETLVAPVPRYQIMLGRTLGGATIATLQGIIVFVLSLFIGFHPVSFGGILLSIPIMLLIAMAFTAFGTAIASKLDDMQAFQLIMNFLVMPLFFLSGAIFPLTNLPPVLKTVVAINPLSYGVDGLRTVLIGISHYGVSQDFLVLTLLTILLMGIGTYLFSKIQI